MAEDPARADGNYYVYCGNDPVRYVDSNGCERIDTVYTYTETTTNEKGNSTTTVYAMKQVEFTNLNATVYTMDGINFNTDEANIVRGEYLAIDDTTSILKGTESYHSLSDVERMDTIQGNRIKRDIAFTAISGALDASGFNLTSILAGVDVAMIDYLGKIVSGEVPSGGWGPADTRAALGAAPYLGTTLGVYDLIKGYSPSYSPYTPQQSKNDSGSTYGKPDGRDKNPPRGPMW